MFTHAFNMHVHSCSCCQDVDAHVQRSSGAHEHVMNMHHDFLGGTCMAMSGRWEDLGVKLP